MAIRESKKNIRGDASNDSSWITSRIDVVADRNLNLNEACRRWVATARYREQRSQGKSRLFPSNNRYYEVRRGSRQGMIATNFSRLACYTWGVLNRVRFVWSTTTTPQSTDPITWSNRTGSLPVRGLQPPMNSDVSRRKIAIMSENVVAFR